MRRGSTPAASLEGPAFSARDVADIVGVSRRRLRYWAQTGLVAPCARTRGGHHRYGFRELVALKATRRLLDDGVSLQRIRKSIAALRRALPRVSDPLRELVLVSAGDGVVVAHRDAAFDAVSGQAWILEVARFEREVSAYRRDPHAIPRVSGARAGPKASRAGAT